MCIIKLLCGELEQTYTKHLDDTNDEHDVELEEESIYFIPISTLKHSNNLCRRTRLLGAVEEIQDIPNILPR